MIGTVALVAVLFIVFTGPRLWRTLKLRQRASELDDPGNGWTRER